jgi:RNA polymerase sigma factor (sigma-70 family)
MSDTEARLNKYSYLVEPAVSRVMARGICHAREDLMAAGMAGLLDAIRRHQGQPERAFKRYARMRIEGALMDWCRAHDSLGHTIRARVIKIGELQSKTPHQLGASDIAGALAISQQQAQNALAVVKLNHIQPDEIAEGPEPIAESLKAECVRMLERMTSRAQTVVRTRLDGHSWAMVAQVAGVSSTNARTIYRNTIKRLQREMKA